MVEKKEIVRIVEAMGGEVFTYIVVLADKLVDTCAMYKTNNITENNSKSFVSKIVKIHNGVTSESLCIDKYIMSSTYEKAVA